MTIWDPPPKVTYTSLAFASHLTGTKWIKLYPSFILYPLSINHNQALGKSPRRIPRWDSLGWVTGDFSMVPPIGNHCQNPANCSTLSSTGEKRQWKLRHRLKKSRLPPRKPGCQVPWHIPLLLHCGLLPRGISSEVRPMYSVAVGRRKHVGWKQACLQRSTYKTTTPV